MGGQDFNEMLYNFLLEKAQTEFNVEQGHLTDVDHQVSIIRLALKSELDLLKQLQKLISFCAH